MYRCPRGIARRGLGSGWGLRAVAGLWGCFVAPRMTPGLSSVDLAAGRFLAYGAMSALVLLLVPGRRRRPTMSQMGWALALSVLGFTGYYWLLVLAIRDAGTEVPTLIIGTIPLWVMLLGKPLGLRWAALLPGLALTAAGLALMMGATQGSLTTGPGDQPDFLRGVAYAAGAMACWTAFALLNAAWLHRHREVSAADWANWLGVATGGGALLMWLALGTPARELVAHPGFACGRDGVCGHRAGLGVAGDHSLERRQPATVGQPVRPAHRERDRVRTGLFFCLGWSVAVRPPTSCQRVVHAGHHFFHQGAPMKYEIPALKRLVFEMTVPIRWGDMDAMNHVNNTTYFRYLEIVRIEWFRSIGCMVDPQGEGPVIVNAFCNFYRQLEYPGDVLMKMYASDPARTTFETWTTIERADAPGAIWAAGGATTIWVDFPKQKAVPLPDWMRQLVEEVE